MHMIVGLGNPGKGYAETRHNIGFRVVYELAKKHQIRVSGVKYQALTGQGVVNGRKVLLVQPQTYMNLSGRSVAPMLNFFKIPLEKMIVIYDELDLPLGRLRMRGSGSAGGHNGVRSLIEHLGTRDFTRMRVGIGHPDDLIPVHDYVLGKFFPEELPVMEKMVQRAVQGVELWLDQGVERAMNQVNRDVE